MRKRKTTKPKVKKSVVKRKLGKKKEVHLGWAALELNSRGESEKDIPSMLETIRKALNRPKLEIFVPIYYKSEEFFEKNVAFFDGYFFIKHEEGLSYHKLNETKYFQGVVAHPATKEVQLISDKDVKKIQVKFEDVIKKKSNFKRGHFVTIMDGLYKGLDGKIKKIYKTTQTCIIEITSLKSRNIEISAPLVSIEAKEEENDGANVVTFFGEN